MSRFIIYGVCDPRDGSIRYVGRTSGPLKKRLGKHYYKATDGTHRGNWFVSIHAAGTKPDAFVLEEVDAVDVNEAESFWIAYFRSVGADLVNSTSGGDGSVLANATSFRAGKAISREMIEKGLATKRTRAYIREPISDATREKLAAAKRGKTRGPMPEATKQKIAASQIGVPKKPLSMEVRAKLSDIRRGKPWTESRRAAFERHV